MTGRRLRALAAALLLALAQPALATTYTYLPADAVFRAADVVAVGTVVDVTSRATDDLVWTVVVVAVDEWLAGGSTAEGEEDPGRDELVLELLGGESAGRRLIVSGSPAWSVGEQVLVAAYDVAGLASPIVGYRQGLWRHTGEGYLDEDGLYLALDAAGALTRADQPTAALSVLEAVRLVVAGEAPDPVPAVPGPASGADGTLDVELTDLPEEETPPLPADRVAAVYAVDDSGGPLLLSERLERAAEAWEALAPDLIDVRAEEGARHAFSYAPEALMGPDLLTLTLAEGDSVRVLVRPQLSAALDFGLRHEVGALLGLSPQASGAMAMAVTDTGLRPSESELAELAALHAFAPADLDRDGVVGFGDLLELAAAYGRTGVNVAGDLDGDGDVDDDDVELLRRSYTFAPPAGARPTGAPAPAVDDAGEQDEGTVPGGGDGDAAPDGRPGEDEPSQHGDDPEDTPSEDEDQGGD